MKALKKMLMKVGEWFLLYINSQIYFKLINVKKILIIKIIF